MNAPLLNQISDLYIISDPSWPEFKFLRLDLKWNNIWHLKYNYLGSFASCLAGPIRCVGWCFGARGGRSYSVVVCPRLCTQWAHWSSIVCSWLELEVHLEWCFSRRRKWWVWSEMMFLRPKKFGLDNDLSAYVKYPPKKFGSDMIYGSDILFKRAIFIFKI